MIGERLRQLRGEMTLEAFGAIAGTTKQYVSQLEKGTNQSPNAVFIGKWASHFKVSMEWITFGGSRKAGAASQSGRLDPDVLRAAADTAKAIAERPVTIERDAETIAQVYDELVGLAGKPVPAAVIVELTRRLGVENGTK